MVKFHIVTYHITVLFFDQGETEIHIIISNRKYLRKTSGRFILFFCDHQAGRCHAHHIHHAAVTPAVIGDGIAVAE